MSFPNVTDLAATTIEYRSKDIPDNVTANNALLTLMDKQGNIQTYDGGTVIQENFSFAENGNGGSYSGYDLLPTGQADVISAAQYAPKQYAVPVIFSGLEADIINVGKEALIDLVDSRVSVAESTMINLLNRHLYLDGTGNNGKNLTGLAAAVAATPTNVYGGIDRSVASNAFWKNQAATATSLIGAPATATTLQSAWNQFIITLTRGTDKPNMIVCAPNVYALFESSLQPQQRFMSADKAGAGFMTLEFQGIPVVFDTLAAGISTNVAFFLNSKYIKWRPHSKRNMVSLDDKSAVNQDATVKTLVWAGNMTSSGAQFQGIFTNV